MSTFGNCSKIVKEISKTGPKHHFEKTYENKTFWKLNFT